MLVGVGHIRVVRELTAAWETAVEEDRVGLVVVEGPTGIGKTAVVQALYEQLAMRQARPAYWPVTFNELNAAGMRNVGPADSEDTGRPGPASASPGIVWRRARAERIYPLLDMKPGGRIPPGVLLVGTHNSGRGVRGPGWRSADQAACARHR